MRSGTELGQVLWVLFLFYIELFISKYNLFQMIRKIIFTNYFTAFIHLVAIKFSFRKVLQKKCFKSCRRNVFNPHYIKKLSGNVDKKFENAFQSL